MKPITEIQSIIDGASGAESYYRVPMFGHRVYMTDSMNELCKAAECFWLVDLITTKVMTLGRRGEVFVSFSLTVNVQKEEGRITFQSDSGSGTLRAGFWTTFPLPELKIFAELGTVDGVNPAWVIMLPGDH